MSLFYFSTQRCFTWCESYNVLYEIMQIGWGKLSWHVGFSKNCIFRSVFLTIYNTFLLLMITQRTLHRHSPIHTLVEEAALLDPSAQPGYITKPICTYKTISGSVSVGDFNTCTAGGWDRSTNHLILECQLPLSRFLQSIFTGVIPSVVTKPKSWGWVWVCGEFSSYSTVAEKYQSEATDFRSCLDFMCAVI